ncbi:hypothetical protein [Ilumatobacter sp.]|uniref:hypothetical protein n=1 Tax=Ilumatobacter sp. TaxID=1967498 RepID=UPI003C3378C9
MESGQDAPEVLIADQIIDDRLGGRTGSAGDDALHGPGPRPTLDRRHTFAATLLLIVMGIVALAVASVIAVGVMIVAAVLVVLGLIARAVSAVSR